MDKLKQQHGNQTWLNGFLFSVGQILSLLILYFYPQALSAQQRPQYSQYVMNNYLLNPALSGIENYTDLRMGHRQQWTGLEGAPKTSFVSAHWALGDAYLWPNPLSFGEDGTDPRSRSIEQDYTASPAHHGIGFSAVSDRSGQLSMAFLDVSYAYHLQLNRRLNLAAGISTGVSRVGIDVGALVLERPGDPALSNASRKTLSPDLSLGLWLYGRRFFSGVSVQQLLPQKIVFGKENNLNEGKLVPHFFFTSGYRVALGEDFNVTPSIMAKWVSNTPISLDANLKIGLTDRFWMGGGYRSTDAFTAMAGINVSHFLNLTYSYDLTVSRLNSVSSGSHEIVLGLLLNNVYKVVCPTRMW
ncbi:type IX secretion system membrane protein PorP/SprF [Pedobacter fastidiosus]|uniref:Type IX secretion system membrane protein PorP/SprF n=1 Tax=Pedobacter fastidiosus TaxID=2765361 RepID=A0ABR7KRJ8_9SPHI|nr:type IX secretion system membrane protein PorP/SprF [Pedobacter fastidiosus]MBC6110680.1 type IX secretion system membrane protein PorP/SprF [Pedobacter fastidiosus]